MDSLTFLQVGVQWNLRRLPSFRGLVNLRSLTIAIMGELEELPEFTHNTKLERLVLPIVPKVDSFPDMAPISNLVEFVITYNTNLCCNGFLNNECDLNNKSCPFLDPSWKVPPAICLPRNRTDKMATDATRAMFAKFPYSVCAPSIETPVREREFPTEESTAQCNGTMYRECEVPGSDHSGMCYNMRMMAIACSGDIPLLEMRKRQILEKVGDSCDPVSEAWLGCQAAK